jgi:hypothetical protein
VWTADGWKMHLRRGCGLCRTSEELLLNPVLISRTDNEKVLIEPSINSLRISVKVRTVRRTDAPQPRNTHSCRRVRNLCPTSRRRWANESDADGAAWAGAVCIGFRATSLASNSASFPG